MTALERRDKAFGDLVDEAVQIGKGNYKHTLRARIRDAVENPKHPNHWPAVVREADALLEEYEHKRVSRIGNAKGEELQIGANARISAEQLAALPDEVLERLLEAKAIERALERGETIPLRAIEGGRVDGVNEHA